MLVLALFTQQKRQEESNQSATDKINKNRVRGGGPTALSMHILGEQTSSRNKEGTEGGNCGTTNATSCHSTLKND